MAKLVQQTISDLMDEKENLAEALEQSTMLMEHAGGFADTVEKSKALLESGGLGLRKE